MRDYRTAAAGSQRLRRVECTYAELTFAARTGSGGDSWQQTYWDRRKSRSGFEGSMRRRGINEPNGSE